MNQVKPKVKNPAKSIKHWLVLACCCGFLASSIGLGSNAIGVFITPVAEDLGIYRGTFAMQSTITYFGMALSTLFVPKTIDRFGIKPTIRFGVLLASLSTLAVAFTESMWVFNVMGAIRGIGMGFFSMVPLTLIVNNWFEKRNGLAVSIGFSFSGVGGAVFSPVFTYLIDTMGWQFSFIIMAILFVVLSLPAMFYPFSVNPREDGYEPYGHVPYKDEKKETISKRGLQRDISWKDLSFILVFTIAMLHTSIMGFSQHIPGFAGSIALSSQVGAWMLSAVMIGNIMFKLILGALSDRIGIIKASVVIMSIHMLSIILFLTVRITPVLLFASWLFGSMFSITAVTLPLLTTYFFGKSQMIYVFPIFSFAASAGRSISTTLIGYSYDFTGNYFIALYLAFLFHIINICLLLYGEKKRKPDFSSPL